ncbi:MAG TPA: hypothetical protein DCS93_13670 [Microscillaceae bacterium]|nr:hypothetical protein [Microscillaceae bacterium]
MDEQRDIYLEKVPDQVYQHMVDLFEQDYHFKNGEKMRLANYYVGISRTLSNHFVQFIDEVKQGIIQKKHPHLSIPDGFTPHLDNLLSTEASADVSFASYDMAVTEQGLQNIEFQAVATYPVSAARLNKCLLDSLPATKAHIFADSSATTWDDFIRFYASLIAGNASEGVIITDRLVAQQKTNFEFYATQKELNASIEIVDMKHIFEQDQTLFYTPPGKAQQPIKVERLYNRILLAEALFEDDYPQDSSIWNFRFDKHYENLKFVNHPVKSFEVSKRLSPYIQHPFNPACFELSAVAQDFRNGLLKYDDYVWKHKWGAAGHRLILSPNATILEELNPDLKDYIAQKKVNFKVFKTADGQEKIVELRFMTATLHQQTIIVPMARIGHVTQKDNGEKTFKIHFGDNNKEGYGFSPVIIFDE